MDSFVCFICWMTEVTVSAFDRQAINAAAGSRRGGFT